jgi:hypothetical protein
MVIIRLGHPKFESLPSKQYHDVNKRLINPHHVLVQKVIHNCKLNII